MWAMPTADLPIGEKSFFFVESRFANTPGLFLVLVWV